MRKLSVGLILLVTLAMLISACGGAAPADTGAALETLNRLLETEIALARRLCELQQRDSRIGLPPSSDSTTANSRARSWMIRAIR